MDFANIVLAFALHPHQDRFLLHLNAHNEKLAETLIIFRKKLAAAIAEGNDLSSLIDQLFLHYIVNTKGPIPEAEDSDPLDVFDAASRYAGLFSLELTRGTEGGSILHIDDKNIFCPEWQAEPGLNTALTIRKVATVINRARYGRDDVIPSHAFGFDGNAVAHTLENAMTMADFAHLAYFKPTYIEKQLKAWGYNSFKWIENVVTDTQGFVAGNNDYLVVCFRGSTSLKDWLVDLNFWKTEAFGGHGKVHRGFQRSLDSVWSRLQTAVDGLGADKKLFICGHSLGAAVAQLAAYRFAVERYRVAHIYVFGSPRAANREFMEHYNQLLGAKTFLHINNKDIVTTVPLELLGFHHLGGKPRSFNNGHQITNLESALAATEEEEKDNPFEKLDVETQERIREQMYDAEKSIRASTRFLTTDPNELSAGSYDTLFNAGATDEHAMDQYLFKFGCAIVDEAWNKTGKAARAETSNSVAQ